MKRIEEQQVYQKNDSLNAQFSELDTADKAPQLTGSNFFTSTKAAAAPEKKKSSFKIKWRRV